MRRIERYHANARSTGFSLIELVLVLVISSTLILTVYQILSISLKAQSRFESPEILQMELLEAMLMQDLMHLRNRPMRDAQGDREPPFLAISGERLSLIRGGMTHFPALAPGGLMRVSYEVRDGHLSRISWPSIDLDPGNILHNQPVLLNVDAFKLVMMDSGLNLFTQWPPLSEGTITGERRWREPMPAAIFIEITDIDGETLQLLVPGLGNE